MNLVKRKDGSYLPAYPQDWELSKKIRVGTEVSAVAARNPDFHRKMFALFNLGFANQDYYEIYDIYRNETTIDAGFYHTGKDGKKYAMSLAYDKMNAETFAKLYEAVLQVISKQIETSGAQIEDELASYY